jgi:hypothetical protein
VDLETPAGGRGLHDAFLANTRRESPLR